MSKQFTRRIGFVCVALLVVGVASYVLVTSDVVVTPDPPEAKAEYTPSNPFDLFEPYTTWPSSTARKTGTAAEWLHTMAPYPTTVSHIDINGDGMVDVLLHQETSSPSSGASLYGILLNRGDLNFDLAYKCVTKVVDEIRRFYGDCADVSQP